MQKECDCSCKNKKNCKRSEKIELKDGFKQDSVQNSRVYTIKFTDNLEDNGYSVSFPQNIMISDFTKLKKVFHGTPLDINYTADHQIILSFKG